MPDNTKQSNNQQAELIEALPRAFKGIWIPREIWVHKSLSMQEKIIWAEIDSLDDPEKGCTASNQYLCRLFDISERTLQTVLARLKSLGLIIYEKFNGRIRTLRSGVKTLFRTSEVQPSRGEETCTSRGEETCTPSQGSPTPPYKDREKRKERKDVPPSVGTSPDSFSSEAKETAELLWDHVLKIHPNHKPPNLKKWSETIEKCHRIDHRSWDDLRAVITYIFKKDPFWVAVIQSPNSLKKHFDTIWIKMHPPNNEGTQIATNREFAYEAKRALESRNEGHLLIVHKESVTFQNGESISMNLPQATFEEILVRRFKLEVYDG